MNVANVVVGQRLREITQEDEGGGRPGYRGAVAERQASAPAAGRRLVAQQRLDGRSDRVAVEWELNEVGDMDKALATVMSDPAQQKQFAAWESKMNSVIEYSDAENWSLR